MNLEMHLDHKQSQNCGDGPIAARNSSLWHVGYMNYCSKKDVN